MVVSSARNLFHSPWILCSRHSAPVTPTRYLSKEAVLKSSASGQTKVGISGLSILHSFIFYTCNSLQIIYYQHAWHIHPSLDRQATDVALSVHTLCVVSELRIVLTALTIRKQGRRPNQSLLMAFFSWHRPLFNVIQ